MRANAPSPGYRRICFEWEIRIRVDIHNHTITNSSNHITKKTTVSNEISSIIPSEDFRKYLQTFRSRSEFFGLSSGYR